MSPLMPPAESPAESPDEPGPPDDPPHGRRAWLAGLATALWAALGLFARPAAGGPIPPPCRFCGGPVRLLLILEEGHPCLEEGRRIPDYYCPRCATRPVFHGVRIKVAIAVES